MPRKEELNPYMEPKHLQPQEVFKFIQANRYPVPKSAPQRFLSRCIDGRYEAEDSLPALAIAGADAGQLGVILAAGREYGLEVNPTKSLEVVTDVVGGVKNLRIHTAEGSGHVCMGGCGHITQMLKDPAAYGLDPKDGEFIAEAFADCVKKGALEVPLLGKHQEGAAVVIKGPFSIYPRAVVETEEGMREIEVFTFHESLVDERNWELAQRLAKEKAVELPDNLDATHLYHAMSEVTQDHLMETAKRLAPGLPLFTVEFSDDSTFKLEESGTI